MSIGNAVPEGLTLIAMAKLGQAGVGFTTILGGNLFTFLVGFGAASLI